MQSFDFSCVALNESCADLNSHNFTHVELITHKKVLGRIFPTDALCYIMLNEPVSLECAMKKVYEILYLNSPSSTYTCCFNLIGDYGVSNQFLVYHICITCDHMNELKIIVSNNNASVLYFVDYPIPICSSLIAPSSIDNLNKNVKVWKNLQIVSPLLDKFAITQLKSDYINDLCNLKSIIVLPINLQKLRTIVFHNRVMHNSPIYFTYTCKLSCKLHAVRKCSLADFMHAYSLLIYKGFSISLPSAVTNILCNISLSQLFNYTLTILN